MCSSAVLLLTLDQLLRGLEIKHGPLCVTAKLAYLEKKAFQILAPERRAAAARFPSTCAGLRLCFFASVIMAACSVRYIRRAPRARWFQRKRVLARGLSRRLYTAAGILGRGET